MKHLTFKTSIRGAGGKGGGQKPPPPPPARLEAPKLGIFKPYSSFSNAEVIDLISDGPIHGLVNQNGRDLETDEMHQGIYFNDTPIALTTESFEGESLFKESLNFQDKFKALGETFDLNISGGIGSDYFQDVYSIKSLYNPKVNLIQEDIDQLLNNGNSFLTSVHVYDKKLGNRIRYNNGYYTNQNVVTKPLYESPNFDGNGWDGAKNLNTNTIITKPNQQIHWGDTLNSKNSFLEIAQNDFQNLLNKQSVSSLEKQIIKDKIDILKDLKKIDLYSIKQFSDGDIWQMGKGWVAPTTKKSVSLNISQKILYVIKVTKTFDRNSFLHLGLDDDSDPMSVDENGNLKNLSFIFKNIGLNLNIKSYDLIIPEINKDKEYTGKVYGLYAFLIPFDILSKRINLDLGLDMTLPLNLYKSRVSRDLINGLKSIKNGQLISISTSNINQRSSLKYNFSNVTSEIKKGYGNQKPFSLFNKTYIDSEYNSRLIGPFRKFGQIRRLREKTLMLKPEDEKPINATLTGGLPRLYRDFESVIYLEGSQDNNRQGGKDYTTNTSEFDEDVIPLTHIVENEETSSVIVSIGFNALKDTLTKQMDVDGSAGAKDVSDNKINDYNNYTSPNKRANIGSELPTVITIYIETGKQKENQYFAKQTYKYDIYGYMPSPVVIDFGNPVNKLQNTSYSNFIKTNSSKTMHDPFILPKLNGNENPSSVKRYVRVYKVSTETNSVLIQKDVYVQKITEIVDAKFSYPYCAMVGNKIDARSISSLPNRSYDCRLKIVKVPSNYHIIDQITKTDVRYQKDAKEYNSGEKEIIYKGDWDGTFKKAWTDNPAWILYDMLTNKRYGLGQHIQESQVNVWELYKIGRYCDAVDDNGYYIGVPDGRGGLEPRFSCNIIFTEPTKLFDCINIISNLFRGSVFFSNSEIHFVDDRPREPIALFTNSNVKDASFNYVNNKKDQIFNIVEVAYLDKQDNFKTKIEYIEDSEDIANRGPQKTVINTYGVTSKSMARRIGLHAIWQTIKENQGVEFVAGLEALLCKPGDLIIIEDELKNRTVNCGRILDIDINNRQLRLDNPYDENNFNGYIEVYTPTGYKTLEELTSLANESARGRINGFNIIKEPLGKKSNNILMGEYLFSEYKGTKAFYTGENKYGKIFCYYDEDLEGWVFSTGKAFQKNNIYDKVLSNLTNRDVVEIHKIYPYNVNQQRYGKPFVPKDYIEYSTGDVQNGSYGGIFDNEIVTQGVRQISKYQISGVTTNILDGAIVTLNENNFNLDLLKFIQPGSPYRCELKNYNNQIYKVIGIREEAQNEYRIVGTKYDSGKWAAIEGDTVIENPQQVFYSNTFNKVISSLPSPYNLYLDSYAESDSGFSLTGSFRVSKGDRFKVRLENKAVGYSTEFTTDQKQFSFQNLNDLGRYDLTVQNLSTNSNNLDSYESKLSKFIVYTKKSSSDFDRPFIKDFNII